TPGCSPVSGPETAATPPRQTRQPRPPPPRTRPPRRVPTASRTAETGSPTAAPTPVRRRPGSTTAASPSPATTHPCHLPPDQCLNTATAAHHTCSVERIGVTQPTSIAGSATASPGAVQARVAQAPTSIVAPLRKHLPGRLR